MKVILYLIVCLLFAPLASAAQARTQDDLAFQRARHLRRGINTCCWFAQSPGRYSKERLESFTTEDDLTLIDHLGFDHIRLSIDAQPLVEWQRGGGDSVFMTELDRVVHAATARHLAVILDVHPESSYKQTLLQGSDSVNHFASLWRALALHFCHTDPELVFFEMMNEPEQTDPYRWMGIQSAVAAQIRSVAPNHTVIAAGAHWSGLQDLLGTEPIPFGNVIYTFHDYDPFAFTHQGATWTSPQVEPLRHVPYPASASLSENFAQEPTLAGQYFVEQYRLDHWDAQRMDATLAFAERWSTEHHVPVYVGEFGVFRSYADEASRVRWLHDMRVAMEAHHLGWAMWDYQDNFGLVKKGSGTTVVDLPVAAALGLKGTQSK